MSSETLLAEIDDFFTSDKLFEGDVRMLEFVSALIGDDVFGCAADG